MSVSSGTVTICTTRPIFPSPKPPWGRRSTVPTLRDVHSIDVEPGSASGTVHRIKHEGVEHLHGRGRGDLYVHLIVDVPTELDDVERDLLRQLAQHRGEEVAEHHGAGLFRKRAKR